MLLTTPLLLYSTPLPTLGTQSASVLTWGKVRWKMSRAKSASLGAGRRKPDFSEATPTCLASITCVPWLRQVEMKEQRRAEKSREEQRRAEKSREEHGLFPDREACSSSVASPAGPEQASSPRQAASAPGHGEYADCPRPSIARLPTARPYQGQAENTGSLNCMM